MIKSWSSAMPDEKSRGGESASMNDTGAKKRRTPSVRPTTLYLAAALIVTGALLVGLTYLEALQDFFAGDAFLWVLRIGIALVIVTLTAFLVIRDRENRKTAESFLLKTSANRRLRLLLESSRDIVSTLDLSVILSQSLERVLAVTGSEFGAVYLREKGEDVLRIALVMGVDDNKVMFRELPLGKGLLGEAASTRTMMAVDDMSKVDERDNVFFGAESPRSQLILPLTAGDKLTGVMVAGTKSTHRYSEDEKDLLRGMSELVGMAITNAELYRIARRSLDALAKQRGITESVLDEMVAGVMTADRDGRVAVFNREAQRITGFSLGEKIQAQLRPETSVDDNPLGPLEHGMLEELRSPATAREGEALIMRKDRTLVPIAYRIYPMVGDKGLLGVAAVFMETGKVEREPSRVEGVDYQVLLRSLSSRIERLYTHPLSRVIDRVRRMDTDQWSKGKDDFAKILEAGSAALLELLEDVEQYINCIAVREWDSPGEHDVTPMIGETIEEVLRSPEYPGVSVVVRLGDLPLAFGYGRMIRTALRKLIENAVEAAHEGVKRVEVTGRELDGVLRIEVRDNGPGVPREAREFIFMPFYTTREGRSGLGLSIAGRVMQKLGGKVGLEETGEGTTFFLEFPTTPRPGPGDDTAPPAPTGSGEGE